MKSIARLIQIYYDYGNEGVIPGLPETYPTSRLKARNVLRMRLIYEKTVYEFFRF